MGRGFLACFGCGCGGQQPPSARRTKQQDSQVGPGFPGPQTLGASGGQLAAGEALTAATKRPSGGSRGRPVAGKGHTPPRTTAASSNSSNSGSSAGGVGYGSTVGAGTQPTDTTSSSPSSSSSSTPASPRHQAEAALRVRAGHLTASDLPEDGNADDGGGSSSRGCGAASGSAAALAAFGGRVPGSGLVVHHCHHRFPHARLAELVQQDSGSPAFTHTNDGELTGPGPPHTGCASSPFADAFRGERGDLSSLLNAELARLAAPEGGAAAFRIAGGSAIGLADEVLDMQLLGKGGYGLVATGVWRQEGRVAVKVMLSNEDKWLESCYKEALLSRVFAHPNVLQSFDFHVAVVTEADQDAMHGMWEQQQQAEQQQQQQLEARRNSCGSSRPPSGLLASDGACSAGVGTLGTRELLRADSFELPAGLTPADALLLRCGSGDCCTSSPHVTLPQLLHQMGARAGQFVTLIVMEYAEIGTLQKAIAGGSFKEGPRLSKWAALRSLLVTAKEVAGGMCLLHSHKVIHGDLTPANVLLKASRIDKRGFIAKVADFGLAKVTRGGVARTEDWCTAAYMAPEMIDGEARLESDVFAFGVCLFSMATGQVPFQHLKQAQVMVGRMAGDLHLTWPHDVSADVRALADRCMLHEPTARPSFREVVEELKRLDHAAKCAHRIEGSISRRSRKGSIGSVPSLLGAPPLHVRLSAVAPGSASALPPAGRNHDGAHMSVLGPHRLSGGLNAGTGGGGDRYAGTATTPCTASAADACSPFSMAGGRTPSGPACPLRWESSYMSETPLRRGSAAALLDSGFQRTTLRADADGDADGLSPRPTQHAPPMVAALPPIVSADNCLPCLEASSGGGGAGGGSPASRSSCGTPVGGVRRCGGADNGSFSVAAAVAVAPAASKFSAGPGFWRAGGGGGAESGERSTSASDLPTLRGLADAAAAAAVLAAPLSSDCIPSLDVQGLEGLSSYLD